MSSAVQIPLGCAAAIAHVKLTKTTQGKEGGRRCRGRYAKCAAAESGGRSWRQLEDLAH